MACFYYFCPCQEVRPSLTEEVTKRGKKKGELDELSWSYIQEKGFTVNEIECESGSNFTKQLLLFENLSKKFFPRNLHWQITKSYKKKGMEKYFL